MVQINQIKYGNPNVIQQEFLFRETYLDSILSEILNYPPPKQEIQYKDELEELVRMVGITMNNEEAEKRYIHYDTKLISFFKSISPEKSVSNKIAKIVDDIMEDTTPVLLKIKFHFNRPRPFQVASYFDLPLYPYPSSSADSPSYISGHAFQGKVICDVLGNLLPDHYGYFYKLSNDIAMSRLHLGLHYRSDVDVAFLAAQKVLANKEFKLKYRL